MAQRRLIVLDLGDHGTAPVVVTEQETEPSPHTGRDLRVVRGQVTTNGQQLHEKFLGALDAHRDTGFWSTEDSLHGRRRWIVRRDSYSISDSRYDYSLTLREAEDLQPTALLIDGLEMHPIRYKEEFSGDELSINATVLVDDTANERLRALIREGAHFPVVRRGINDTPVQMRFGMCGWSEHDEGTKYDLVMVDPTRDDPEDAGIHIVAAAQAQRHGQLAYRIEFTEGLAKLLVAKGIITEAELEGVSDRAHEKIWERRMTFLQVDDAEQLKW
jgi:hypothetical protein